MIKYVEIEEFIMKNIRNGYYGANDKILSENQLADKFNTSRMTARKAIENLVARNYLYKIMGKGTFVVDREDKVPIYLNQMVGFQKRTLEAGGVPSTKVLEYKIKKPNVLVAKKMKIDVTEDIIYAERLRCLDGEPVVLEVTNMRKSLFEDMSRKDMESSKYAYIRSKGYDINRMSKEYFAVIPEKKVQDYLKMDKNMAAFKIEILSYSENNQLLEYTKLFYNQKKYSFMQELKK